MRYRLTLWGEFDAIDDIQAREKIELALGLAFPPPPGGGKWAVKLQHQRGNRPPRKVEVWANEEEG
jgi:hypothetical protein